MGRGLYLGSGISPAQRERIWTSICDKEVTLSMNNHRETFTMNPYNPRDAKPVAFPINHRDRHFLNKDRNTAKYIFKIHERRHPSEVPRVNRKKFSPDKNRTELPPIDGPVRALLSVHKKPMEKYPKPVTESMEVGWAQLPELHSKKSVGHNANFPRKQTSITKLEAHTHWMEVFVFMFSPFFFSFLCILWVLYTKH